MEKKSEHKWLKDPKRWKYFMLFVVFVLATLNAFVKWESCLFSSPALCEAGKNFYDIFFNTFVVGVLATLIAVLVGQHVLQKLVNDWDDQRLLGSLKKFWLNSRNSEFAIIVGLDKDTQKNNGNSMRVSHETLLSVAYVQTILHQVYGNALTCRVICIQDIHNKTDELSNMNIVLLGGDKAIPGTTNILEAVGLPYRQNCTSEEEKKVYKVESEDYWITALKKDSLNKEAAMHYFQKECAIVSRIVTNEMTHWYLISGNMGIGTVMAARVLASPDMAKRVMNDDGLLDKTTQQAVLGVSNKTRQDIQENSFIPTLEDGDEWRKSKLDRKQIRSNNLLEILTKNSSHLQTSSLPSGASS